MYCHSHYRNVRLFDEHTFESCPPIQYEGQRPFIPTNKNLNVRYGELASVPIDGLPRTTCSIKVTSLPINGVLFDTTDGKRVEITEDMLPHQVVKSDTTLNLLYQAPTIMDYINNLYFTQRLMTRQPTQFTLVVDCDDLDTINQYNITVNLGSDPEITQINTDAEFDTTKKFDLNDYKGNYQILQVPTHGELRHSEDIVEDGFEFKDISLLSYSIEECSQTKDKIILRYEKENTSKIKVLIINLDLKKKTANKNIEFNYIYYGDTSILSFTEEDLKVEDIFAGVTTLKLKNMSNNATKFYIASIEDGNVVIDTDPVEDTDISLDDLLGKNGKRLVVTVKSKKDIPNTKHVTFDVVREADCGTSTINVKLNFDRKTVEKDVEINVSYDDEEAIESDPVE